jgi:hypothetical protein
LEKQIKIVDNLLAALNVNVNGQSQKGDQSQKGGQIGGQNKELNVRPRDRFNFLPNQIQPQYRGNMYQQNQFNAPYPQSPAAYPYSPYPYPYPYPYSRYGPTVNKDTSKLAFYVELELALFPGKTANLLQKSVVQCQSTFEKIRQAYAEIFGYEYRPGAFNETYAYNSAPVQQPSSKYKQPTNNKTTKHLKSLNSHNRTNRRFRRRYQRDRK